MSEILRAFTYCFLCSWRDLGKESLPEPNTTPTLLTRKRQPAAQVVVTQLTPVQVSPRSVRKSRQLQVTSLSKRPIVYHSKSRLHPALLSLLPRHRIFLLLSLNPTLAIIIVEQTPLEDKVAL